MVSRPGTKTGTYININVWRSFAEADVHGEEIVLITSLSLKLERAVGVLVVNSANVPLQHVSGNLVRGIEARDDRLAALVRNDDADITERVAASQLVFYSDIILGRVLVDPDRKGNGAGRGVVGLGGGSPAQNTNGVVDREASRRVAQLDDLGVVEAVAVHLGVGAELCAVRRDGLQSKLNLAHAGVGNTQCQITDDGKTLDSTFAGQAGADGLGDGDVNGVTVHGGRDAGLGGGSSNRSSRSHQRTVVNLTTHIATYTLKHVGRLGLFTKLHTLSFGSRGPRFG